MNSLVKTLTIVKCFNKINPVLMQSAVRLAHGWNKDYKPGPYPKTQAEREAAAKKYNLLPEEYEPYADDGLGYGDYPKLPVGLGAEARDPFYPYDYPDLKRNFGETLHVDCNVYSEDRHSLPEPPRFPNYFYSLCFFSVMTGFFILYSFLDNYKMYCPVAVKQYPGDGRKHYTFERD